MSKRVLIVAPNSTHPVTGGTQVRMNGLIRHMTEDLGWEVDFFAAAAKLRQEAWGPNMDYLRHIFVPHPGPPAPKKEKSFIHLRRALGGGVIEAVVKDLRKLMKGKPAANAAPAPGPKHLHTYTNPKKSGEQSHPSPVSQRLQIYERPYMEAALREVLEEHEYDAIIVVYVWMSKVVEWLMDQPDRPQLICDTIDIQYVREQRLHSFRNGAAFDFASEKALEIAYLSRYDLTLGITPEDTEELQRSVPDKPSCTVSIEASVAPYMVLDEELYRVRRETQHTYDLIFIGADNEANRLAVEKLLRDIVPLLLARKPDLSVAIAGKVSTGPAVERLAGIPGVQIKGYVDSLEDFYASGRVLAAPIPAGGGIKVKLLEAMAHGVPVVTTPIGAEGIAFEDGVHGFVTEDDARFADNVMSLLNNPEMLETFSLATQRNILERLSPRVVYAAFDAQFGEHTREPVETPAS